MPTPSPYAARLAAALDLPEAKIAAAIDLFDNGNTLPFIARYRKEATGGLDEEQLRAIQETLESQRALDERRAVIVASIGEQGRLTPELALQLEAATSRTALEDLYAPYKPKRRTRASVARELGVQPLADQILAQSYSRESAEALALPFLNKQLTDVAAVLASARDIVAEAISDHAGVRAEVRAKALRFGAFTSERVKGSQDERGVYQLYYEARLRIDLLRPHQMLALNRGESQKVLRVNFTLPERDWRDAIQQFFPPNPRSPWAAHLIEAGEDGAKRLLLPAIERDLRSQLTAEAERHAIQIFAQNLRGLLLQPPLAGHTVLGLDPGFRTGCKVAVVDPSGKLLSTTTILPHAPQKQWRDALALLEKLVVRHQVTLITIGNGTASRETEQLVAELIRNLAAAGRPTLHYLIVNEAGASVYSASPLARAELPELDVSLRGAVSIARRAQDPLAELVKIEPKAIGVGLYQHDVDQKALGAMLDGVVESVVNQVGVDLNSASPALLAYVAGIGPKLAEKIVAHRNEQGPFQRRADLRAVSGLGPKAFEQSAGFLRVRDGAEPLDASAIHPESYALAREVLRRAKLTLREAVEERKTRLDQLSGRMPLPALAQELAAGEPTLADILAQLVRPGRDPRAELPAPLLRSDLLSMEDLLPGHRLMGTVRNVVDFGAFIDIGVKQDGLLHRSRQPHGLVLGVGDVLEVEILSIEKERGRISLGIPEQGEG